MGCSRERLWPSIWPGERVRKKEWICLRRPGQVGRRCWPRSSSARPRCVRPGCRGGCSGRRRAAVGGRAPEGLSPTVVKPRPNCVFLSSWPTVRLVGGTRPAWETRTGEGTMMFARIVTFTGATDIDAGIRYLSDPVAPLLAEQKGFRGVTASADRSGGVMGVLSLWETEADRDASGRTLVNAREEGRRVGGGEMSVEHFEELLVETAQPPKVGCSLLLRRLSMDPAMLEEHLDFFRGEVLPQMKASPGFCAVRNMTNRQTGEAIVGSVWTDQVAMDTWAEA